LSSYDEPQFKKFVSFYNNTLNLTYDNGDFKHFLWSSPKGGVVKGGDWGKGGRRIRSTRLEVAIQGEARQSEKGGK